MKHPPDSTKKSYYAMGAFTYLAAMVSSNMALQHVNYPTQVIGKSCKPIPVMILGVFLARKSYPLSKYLFVLLIVIGVGIFMYKDKVSGGASTSLIGAGELLLVSSSALLGLIEFTDTCTLFSFTVTSYFHYPVMVLPVQFKNV